MKQHKSSLQKQKAIYYDDPLTGPEPVLKKSSHPTINAVTAYPPPLPLLPQPSLIQEQKNKSSPSSLKQIKTKVVIKKDTTPTWTETFWSKFGIIPDSLTKKINNGRANTLKELEVKRKKIQDEMHQKTAEMLKFREKMAKDEQNVMAFLSHGGNTHEPEYQALALSFEQNLTRWRQAASEARRIDQRERNIDRLISNIYAEEHTDELNQIILKYDQSNNVLGGKSRKLAEMEKVDKITKEQIVLSDVSDSLISNNNNSVIYTDDAAFSDDVLKMLARCENRIKQYGLPPPVPIHIDDENNNHPPDSEVDKNLLNDPPPPIQEEEEKYFLEEEKSEPLPAVVALTPKEEFEEFREKELKLAADPTQKTDDWLLEQDEHIL